MSGDVETEATRRENETIVLGALVVKLGPPTPGFRVDVPDESDCLIVRFDFMKSAYRLTVERLPTQAERHAGKVERAIDVVCPRCGAQPGDRCRSTTGYINPTFHSGRIAEA